MSDTVKLIIEIPKDVKADIDNGVIHRNIDKIYLALANGTPLDDVKAETKQLRSHSAKFRRSDGSAVYADSQDILDILDNIGKESEEGMEEYKPLTPSFRIKIDDALNRQIEELKTCEPNMLVMTQISTLQAYKRLISDLPDGYLMPIRK